MTARARAGPEDRGQAVPLMMVLLLAAMVAVVASVEIGRLLDESAQARTAADAAALAGAAGGRDEAARIAAANGGRLLSYVEDPPAADDDAVRVTVTVQVGRVDRTARAEGLVEWVAPQ